MHATICDLISDLTQNAFEAQAEETILTIEESEKQLRIVISDNGCGMDADTLERAKDPFYTDGEKHKHRKVGLGLPFLLQTAEMTGGTVSIESQKEKGTTVTVHLDPAHVDLPEFGDFTTTAVTLMTYDADENLTIERTMNGKNYTLIKNDLQDALGDLNSIDSLMLLKQFIQEHETEIKSF